MKTNNNKQQKELFDNDCKTYLGCLQQAAELMAEQLSNEMWFSESALAAGDLVQIADTVVDRLQEDFFDHVWKAMKEYVNN